MRYCYAVLFCTLLWLTPPPLAAQVSVEQFINNMVRQHGWPESWVRSILREAKKRNSILDIMSRPAGQAKPWYDYRKIFLTTDRIQQGVQFWRSHVPALRKASQTYGVPPEFIVAIIGVETSYGRVMGDIRVLDALYTLGFYYPRRADFFRGELEDFLLMVREEGFDPFAMQGSYAGAMGLGQFIPSSYRNYAVDFDGDGVRNIWSNETDAIGSIANYFHEHGWQPGQPVLEAVQVRAGAAAGLLALEYKPQYPLTQLQQQGLLYHGQQPLSTTGLLVDLEVAPNQMGYWVGFNNFYVITRYNRSNRYAMAVYQLAQEIAHAYQASMK